MRVEHYCEAIGALVSSLSDKPELLRRIVEYVFVFFFIGNNLILNYTLYNRLHLVIGTPSSILSSQIILAVVDQDENSEDADGPNLFQKLKLMRKVAQKALESAGNEKSFIARPARTARDIIKGLDDDTLIGLF